jgi:hypothetical protein
VCDWGFRRERERERERERFGRRGGGEKEERLSKKKGKRRRLPTDAFCPLSLSLLSFSSLFLSPTHNIVQLDAKLEAQRVELLLGCWCFFEVERKELKLR